MRVWRRSETFLSDLKSQLFSPPYKTIELESSTKCDSDIYCWTGALLKWIEIMRTKTERENIFAMKLTDLEAFISIQLL